MFGGTKDEDVEVDFSEVQMGPRIGVGCFGEVFKARWRQTTVAVKRLFDQTLTDHSLKVCCHLLDFVCCRESRSVFLSYCQWTGLAMPYCVCSYRNPMFTHVLPFGFV